MSVVIFSNKHVLHGLSKDDFFIKLKATLKGRVLEAWVFGSITSDDFNTSSSDVDLILIIETTKPFLERWKDFSDVLDLALRLDLLIYTPSEWLILKQETLGFWADVHRQRQRLL